MPALGRPFSLGMLYDCRTDELIPAMNLWNPELLHTNRLSQSQTSTTYEVITEDSLQMKTRALNIEGHLALSAVLGLCKQSGSAKYMDDRTSSSRQSRVSLHLKSMSRFEQLSMAHLLFHGCVQNPKVLHSDIATHVVTGISYGADAFMVFDHTTDTSKNARTITGELEIKLNDVMSKVAEAVSTKVSDAVSTKVSEAVSKVSDADSKEKSKNEPKPDNGVSSTYKDTQDIISKKTKCTVYSDFPVEDNPVTFEDAVAFYKKLSYKGSEEKTAVPKVVFLLPLCKLPDSDFQQVLHQITTTLTRQTTEVLESLHQIRTEIQDLLPSKSDTKDTSKNACNRFGRLKIEIEEALRRFDQYESSLRLQIKQAIPKIRSGQDESCLSTILATHIESQLCHKISTWVKTKSSEIGLLGQYIKALNDAGIKFCDNELELANIVHDFEMPLAFVLSFCDVKMADPDIRFLVPAEGFTSETGVITRPHWFEDRKQLQHVRSQVEFFMKKMLEGMQYGLENATPGHQTQVPFVVCSSQKQQQSIVETLLYCKGTAEVFDWSIRPSGLHCTAVGQTSVCLNWICDPKPSASDYYYVAKWRKYGLNAALPWNPKGVKASSDATAVTLPDLLPNTWYQFKVALVMTTGIRNESEICGPVKTESEPKPGLCRSLNTPGPSPLSKQELERLRSEMGMDCERHYNFGVCGETGTGKSALINAVCDLKDTDSKAAAVGHYGVGTKNIKSFKPAKYPHTVLWDIPGTNSPDFPLDKYFPEQKLAAFDLLIIVTDKERFTETGYNLAVRAVKAQVPVIFVRTKADIAVDEARKRIEREGSSGEGAAEEVQISKEDFEEKIRDQCYDTMRLDMEKVGLSGNVLCILSSYGFDEKRKDKYPAFDKKAFLDRIRALAMSRRPQPSK